jgi:Phage tail sheath C-terminal domain
MTLNSPGVEVQVIDESFYTPAEPGTRPLIIVATAENKPNGSGTGVALGTLKANTGLPYVISSQRDLTNTFGNPLFYVDSSQNPIHGGEQNEYGLQAAYSLLGVSNSAVVVRADIDLAQLSPSYTAPEGDPNDGSYWFDTMDTRLGLFEWNGASSTTTGGQTFSSRSPYFITDPVYTDSNNDYAPKTSVGAIGDYAVVATTTVNKTYFKKPLTNTPGGQWVEVGSDAWAASWPAVTSTLSNPSLTVGDSMLINGSDSNHTISVPSSPNNNVAGLANAINNSATMQAAGIYAAVINGRLNLYGDYGVTITIAAGTGNLVASSASTSSLGIAIGTYNTPQLAIAPHTSVPRWKLLDNQPAPTGSVWIKTTNVALGAYWVIKVWNETTKTWSLVPAPVYANNQSALFALDSAGGGTNIATGSLYVQANVSEYDGTGGNWPLAEFKIFRRTSPAPTTFVSQAIKNSTFTNSTNYTFTMAETIVGQAALGSDVTVSFTATGSGGDADVIAGAINAAGFQNVVASVDSLNRVVISHNAGGDMRLHDGTNTPLIELGYVPYDPVAMTGTSNFYLAPVGDAAHTYIVTNWQVLIYTASDTVPGAVPNTDTIWYSSARDEVDIMIHNGTTWVGYLDSTSPYYDADSSFRTDPNGPIVSATQPTKQSDGTPLRNGDIWVNSGDSENYPELYKWDGFNLRWVAVDKTDHVTEDGIIFADARYNVAGSDSDQPGRISDLLTSNFLDFDAPDPTLYPRGTLLWNTRRSGNNVKRFVRNYIDVNTVNPLYSHESQIDYYPHRWINDSGTDSNGVGLFGRHAQRAVVVKALKSMVDTEQRIREHEVLTFNLMSCPGYPELISNMVNLNTDRKTTAFVVGDSPFRLTPDSTSLQNWGANTNLAVDNGDNGLVTYDDYLGVYYPSGYTTDNFGNYIVVPPSHMMLRTIALSDGVSYPWFAPAGTRRGHVNNATAVGYIDATTGEFQSISLNDGQRDTLYSVGINPITFLTGTGIVAFGQKTRASAASSLDRINVARLTVYLRSQLDKLAKPYIFEPNDKITRDEIKAAANSLLLELLGQRAIYDYLVVCDDSNNTPDRIDRNELYLDIAIEPVKAVEFIYIPLRLKNTGAIAGLASK